MPASNPSAATFQLEMELRRRFISTLGVGQLLNGEIVTDLGDRLAIARMLHAEKNQDIEFARRLSQRTSRTESVDKNETITIGGNRTETVGKDESITIGGNRSVTLRAAGLSLLGVQQCLNGLPVTAAADRQRLAAAVVTALGITWI